MRVILILSLSFLCTLSVFAQHASPIFKDGEAQIVPAFNDSEQWIRHDLI